jgi:sterol desaturase/sphingolipid hydroxylase (fatty acid hydroxylase superfamily)/3-mercaptopyruvate sulfurtransferase SseA
MTARPRHCVLGLALAAAFAMLLGWEAPAVAGQAWVVDPAAAEALIESGALVLDARAPALKQKEPLPGAVRVVWQTFSEPDLPLKGRLLGDDAVLTRLLQAYGVSAGVPVVVLGDPLEGRGEDGRIAWMLRYLGHDAAVIVDGGLPALRALGLREIRPRSGVGDFVVHRRPELIVTRDELVAALGRPGVVVLDTREAREYAGEMPFGESRGGHVPGARHIWFRDLLTADGTLLPRDRLQAKLAALGVAETSEVIVYCTGGVRSGWVTAVLNDRGVNARNFAGSMWDWSAGDPGRYPLVASDVAASQEHRVTEAGIRLAIFLAIFAIVALVELVLPRRALSAPRAGRWLANLGILAIDIAVQRLTVGAVAIGAAVWAETAGFGLFHLLGVPFWAACVLAFVLLDLTVWAQHLVTHKVPLLWRLHQVHHTDLDVDLTTGVRFHPVEILLSALLKALVVVLLGAPAVAVLVFEAALNAAALATHGNYAIPARVDRMVRWLVVTPDMHRVHHSIDKREADHNYGFFLSVWDRLFRTLKDEPDAGHLAMRLGVRAHPEPLGLGPLLALPLKPLGGARPLADAGSGPKRVASKEHA